MVLLENFSLSLFIWQVFVLFSLILPIIALIDILRNKFEGNNKLIWTLVVIFIGFIGPVLYFVIGRKQKIRQPL